MEQQAKTKRATRHGEWHTHGSVIMWVKKRLATGSIVDFQHFESQQAGKRRHNSAAARSNPQLDKVGEGDYRGHVDEPAAMGDLEPGQRRQRHQAHRAQVSQGQ